MLSGTALLKALPMILTAIIGLVGIGVALVALVVVFTKLRSKKNTPAEAA